LVDGGRRRTAVRGAGGVAARPLRDTNKRSGRVTLGCVLLKTSRDIKRSVI
jgi:hypothetical protein